ncbi:hypothetical protein GVY41_18935 [Frigidibacter albus]|uniref:Uncharacterized protein n=1 Tax=Frigidibacter albus TaxID=1465486 RepID=A0A6L8VMX2_9RHOB|nr:hypothetical protein [Frigidibacter albus]MZQ91151.1 hypothetical protein [Frigidibacter albus]NBE33077.1 hypothetical protein [Frigidibacter albus]
MAASEKNVDKGGAAEEAFREYFSSLGSFVVRGVPVKVGGEDVTDVDLWVYTRTNAHSRNVTIVDVKNKRRGKAFERVIWVKGLQVTLGADEAIVATQGAKIAVYDFAQRLDVKVISSSVFDSLVRKYSVGGDRYYAEELDSIWSQVIVDRKSIKARIDEAKSRISFGVNFGALNNWIDEASLLLRVAVERERQPGPITRGAYYLCSLVAMAADYLGRKHVLSDHEMRLDFFRKGLTFGGNDDGDGRRYIEFAEALVTEHLDSTGGAAAKVRTMFYRSIDKSPFGGLIESFSRSNAGVELYKAAIQLENEAFRRAIRAPRSQEGIEGKSVLGLIGDFADIPRRDLLGENAMKSEQPQPPLQPKLEL